ncbi:hypothetical protein CB1_000390039 [Camelus ferus]|nr:hypothetical protein CB1_000390039 [Camelus ferus]
MMPAANGEHRQGQCPRSPSERILAQGPRDAQPWCRRLDTAGREQTLAGETGSKEANSTSTQNAVDGRLDLGDSISAGLSVLTSEGATVPTTQAVVRLRCQCPTAVKKSQVTSP